MTGTLWDGLPDSPVPHEAAQSKRPVPDTQPTKEPMRAGQKPAQRRNPSGEQKKVRRQMARQAAFGGTPSIWGPENPVNVWGKDYVSVDDIEERLNAINNDIGAWGVSDDRVTEGQALQKVLDELARAASKTATDAPGSRTIYCPECGGPLVGSYEEVQCDKCGRGYSPLSDGYSVLGLEGDEVFRINPGGVLKAVEYAMPSGPAMASKTANHGTPEKCAFCDKTPTVWSQWRDSTGRHVVSTNYYCDDHEHARFNWAGQQEGGRMSHPPVTSGYREDHPEMVDWYKERLNVTYTDGSPVKPGDKIRYHQAPGGLLETHNTSDWKYGTAVLVDSPVPGVKEMVLENDEVASWGGKEKYNLYGHVIERAPKGKQAGAGAGTDLGNGHTRLPDGQVSCPSSDKTYTPSQTSDGPVCPNCSKSLSTSTKESTTMTAQPTTEADLVARLAAATSLTEQTEASAALNDFRTAHRETLAQRDSFDWTSMGDLPPTREQQMLAHLTSGNLPPASASVRVGHTEATDFLDDLTPTATEDHVMGAHVRAEATRWYEGVWSPVKADPSEFSSQAKNAAVRTGTNYGLQAAAATSVFLDTVRHLASREGLSTTALEETVDTYVSDGKTTLPVGVESGAGGSMDEWGIGSDANNSADPKSTTDRGDAPSLSEGTQPEGDKAEGVDNPNYGVGPDKSTWDVGSTEDKAMTQKGSSLFDQFRTDGLTFEAHSVTAITEGTEDTCHCGKPIQFFEGSWYHLSADGPVDWKSHGPQTHPDTPKEKADKAKGGNPFKSSKTGEALPSNNGLGEGIDEGSQPEGDHAESPIKEPEPAQDKSSGGNDPDNLNTGGTGDATSGASPGTPYHSSLIPLPTIAESFRGRQVSESTRTLAAGLERCASLDGEVGGVSARVMVAHLLASPEVPVNVKHALNAHLKVSADGEGGQTCSVCGDSIGKDPAGENPSTYHHTNGTSHDHEAKPGGGGKEGQRAPFAREGAGEDGGWNVGTRLMRGDKEYEITNVTPAGSAGRAESDGPTYHAKAVVDGKVQPAGQGNTLDIWSKSMSNPKSDFKKKFVRDSGPDTSPPEPLGFSSSKTGENNTGFDGRWISAEIIGEEAKNASSKDPQGNTKDGYLWLPYVTSAKTATRYCTTHQVYVGDGNHDTHTRDSCNVETRKKKDASTKTGISVKNVGVDSDGNGTGTTSDGTKVKFRLTDKERSDLKAVLYSDLAMNFSGVDIEPGDIISEQGGGNSMTGDNSRGGKSSALDDFARRVQAGIGGVIPFVREAGGRQTIKAKDLKKGDMIYLDAQPPLPLEVVSNPRRKRIGGQEKVEVDTLVVGRSGESRPRQFSPDKDLSISRYGSKQAAGSPEGWWPRDRPSDHFPGETTLGCPKCGGPVTMQGYHGPGGRLGDPGGGTTLVCNQCGFSQSFGHDASLRTAAGPTYQTKKVHGDSWTDAGESTEDALKIIKDRVGQYDEEFWLVRNNFNGAVNVYAYHPAMRGIDLSAQPRNLGSYEQFYGAPYREASLKTADLKDLDDGALDKEHRRVMEQQNNTRTTEAQEALKAWRKEVEQEKARRKQSLKTADRSCGCPDDYHLADCPILTGGRDFQDAPDPDDFYDDDGYYGSRKTAGWLDSARKVVDNKGFVSVDHATGNEVETEWRGDEISPDAKGVVLDMTTANMLVTVHDALNETNAAKFAALPLLKAVDMGWSLVSRSKS